MKNFNQSDSDPSKIKVRYPNTAGHKNDDQNPSALYHQVTGYLHCFVYGGLGFADDRDDLDYVRNQGQTGANRSIEQQANIDYNRYEIAICELDFEETPEFKIRDIFVFVNQD